MKFKGLILAAGRGSRLKNLTDHNPKCLVKVKGKQLIEWQKEAFRGANIKDVALVTGYKSNLLDAKIKFHNSRWDQTNMVHSLLCAKSYFDICIIVSYSESY